MFQGSRPATFAYGSAGEYGYVYVLRNTGGNAFVLHTFDLDVYPSSAGVGVSGLENGAAAYYRRPTLQPDGTDESTLNVRAGGGTWKGLTAEELARIDGFLLAGGAGGGGSGSGGSGSGGSMSAPAGGSSLASGPVGSSGSAGGKLGAPLLARFAAILAGQGATAGGAGTGRFASFQAHTAALDGAPAAAPSVGAGNVNQTNGGWFGGWANPLNWRRGLWTGDANAPDEYYKAAEVDLGESLVPAVEMGAAAAQEVGVGVENMAAGAGQLVVGLGKFAHDMVALPIDLVGTLFSTRWDPYSFSGAESQAALQAGASPTEISGTRAFGLATLGLGPAAYEWYTTGDPTSFQKAAGALLASAGLGLAMERAGLIESPEVRPPGRPGVEAPASAEAEAATARAAGEVAAEAAEVAPNRTLKDPLPPHPKKPTQANPHAPDPEATGPHTVLGTRTDPKQSPAPYRQGITYDAEGNPLGRTDVTTHGRGDHPNPHYHPYDPNIRNPFDPANPGNFGPQRPIPD